MCQLLHYQHLDSNKFPQLDAMLKIIPTEMGTVKLKTKLKKTVKFGRKQREADKS